MYDIAKTRSEMDRKQFEMERTLYTPPRAAGDRPPPLEPGDRFIIDGVLGGVFIGGALFGFIAYFLGLASPVSAGLLGVVLGGLTGTGIGARIKLRRLGQDSRSKTNS